MSNIFNFELDSDMETCAPDYSFDNSMVNGPFEDWPDLRSLPKPENLPKVDKQRIFIDLDEVKELQENCKALQSKLRKLLRKINRPSDLTLETIDLTNE